MKKTLIIASLLAFSMTTVLAAETPVAEDVKTPAAQTEVQPAKPVLTQEQIKKREMKREQFEKRLKLTEEQKVKIKELQQNGREQMKPIIEQIQAKRQEAEAVRRSRIAVEMQQEKLAEIQKDIQALKKQAHELRMQNMKDFEAILTKKQQKELKKMKEEGRKRFEKEHKNRPVFGPGYGIKGPHHMPMGPGPVIPNALPPQPPVE